MRSENEARRATIAQASERVALLQNELIARTRCIRRFGKLIAYASGGYRSAVRKTKLRALQRRLWLAIRKLPIRESPTNWLATLPFSKSTSISAPIPT